jgi:hypothetical protein
MSIILAVVLTVSASPSGGTQADAATVQFSAPPAVRNGRELADATHAALRKWAKAGDRDADSAARDLFTIFGELQADTRMARSARATLRTTVRARLDQLCTQISKRIAKDNLAAKEDPKVKSVAATKNDRPLAQVGVPVGGGGAGFGIAGGGQNANAKADSGQALVDLIRSTISPKSWDVNGGECTIYYWQQQHAIVVRATGDVHDQVSDTLQQLDRATH